MKELMTLLECGTTLDVPDGMRDVALPFPNNRPHDEPVPDTVTCELDKYPYPYGDHISLPGEEFRMAHADVDSENPPPRRIGAVVLVRDQQSRVLLVKPTYKDGHQLPGGGAHAGEYIADAAARELEEETGIKRKLTHFVGLDQVPFNPETGVGEGFNVVCNGGTLSNDAADAVAVPEAAADELSAFVWVYPDDLEKYTTPYQAHRIRAALVAIEKGSELPLLVMGQLSA